MLSYNSLIIELGSVFFKMYELAIEAKNIAVIYKKLWELLIA